MSFILKKRNQEAANFSVARDDERNVNGFVGGGDSSVRLK